MTRIDKPALLKRLFDMSAQYSGQIVSYRKLQGHLQDAETPQRSPATSICSTPRASSVHSPGSRRRPTAADFRPSSMC